MNIGEIIDNNKVGQRPFNPDELATAMKRGAMVTLMSWGVHAWMKCEDMWLRFMVQGHHHKGYVYIVLAWNDTFTIYYTNRVGKIVDKREEVYIDELVQVIDKRVEYIAKYG